jgi:hypothetical protein
MGALKERPLFTWCDASLYARLPGVVTRSKAGTWVLDVFGCLTGCCMWRLMQIGEVPPEGYLCASEGSHLLGEPFFLHGATHNRWQSLPGGTNMCPG